MASPLARRNKIRLNKTISSPEEKKKDEKEKKKRKKVRWTNYEIYELTGEFVTPCVASQPLLLDETTDDTGRKIVSKQVFPRDERGKAYFPPGWVAGMMEEVARKDLWTMSPQLKATKVRITLPPERILEIFKKLRFAAYYVHNLTFFECEILGDASPVVQRYAGSYTDQRGQKKANVFDGETFQAGTQFKLKIIAPKIFKRHIQTLLEIGCAVEGIGPGALRRKDFGRWKVLSFERVEVD